MFNCVVNDRCLSLLELKGDREREHTVANDVMIRCSLLMSFSIGFLLFDVLGSDSNSAHVPKGKRAKQCARKVESMHRCARALILNLVKKNCNVKSSAWPFSRNI